MEFLQFLVVAVGVLVFYFGDRILRTLTPKSQRPDTSEGGERFSIWMTVETVYGEEFEVGYVDDWDLGHRFSVGGEAEIDPPWNFKRANFKFYSAQSALSGTHVIGWCRKHENEKHGNWLEGSISLTPGVARDLLDELRRNPKANLHVAGFKAEADKLKITNFSLSPIL